MQIVNLNLWLLARLVPMVDYTQYREMIKIILILPLVTSLVALGAPKQKLECYLPYASSKDHIVSGCEIDGYHLRYDIAKDAGIFMAVLPNGFRGLEDTPTFFAINTLSFDGNSLKKLFENDQKGMLTDNPKTKVVKATLPKPLHFRLPDADLFPKLSKAMVNKKFLSLPV